MLHHKKLAKGGLHDFGIIQIHTLPIATTFDRCMVNQILKIFYSHDVLVNTIPVVDPGKVSAEIHIL